ncbi:hypothetical protein PG996_002985 [Apiospora saccharicola]|uniref:Transposase n=1 Tax=Apiospora saccharicola TaxID=335842 RepID=A0ABR1VZY9_9PEZI
MERVKDALRKSPGQIHIQYDGWKSGNRYALYGITYIFRDSNNRPQKCVLGLPELIERHTGENIAGQIIEIIREYEISDKLGYFILDNAGNNKTSMGELGLEFGFDWEKRWVRYVSHVVNIVVKQMLYGKNPDAFEKEVFEGLHTVAKEHEVWRRRGSVGKWYNFAVLKKHRPVGVVVDNAIRWLSQFLIIERALVLRPFYNSFVQRALNEWEKVNLTRAGHIKKGSKLPFFLTEENRISWDLIHAYEFLLETLESAKRAVANFPDGYHLAVNINLGWLKLNEYYEYLNDSPLVYGAAVLYYAYRWALFNDLWGDDDERRLWITKAKEMV